jgi:hypothetical protein
VQVAARRAPSQERDGKDDDRDVEPMGTQGSSLSRRSDEHCSKLGREDRPNEPVRRFREPLPDFCGRIRLNDEDWNKSQCRRKDNRL